MLEQLAPWEQFKNVDKQHQKHHPSHKSEKKEIGLKILNERIIIPMTVLGIAYPLKPTPSVTPGRSGCACLQFGGAFARQIPLGGRGENEKIAGI